MSKRCLPRRLCRQRNHHLDPTQSLPRDWYCCRSWWCSSPMYFLLLLALLPPPIKTQEVRRCSTTPNALPEQPEQKAQERPHGPTTNDSIQQQSQPISTKWTATRSLDTKWECTQRGCSDATASTSKQCALCIDASNTEALFYFILLHFFASNDKYLRSFKTSGYISWVGNFSKHHYRRFFCLRQLLQGRYTPNWF